jgi:8-oxo-(d)GTP phosphatase
VTLYLVRHALALAKSSWAGLDSDRPLDAKGRRQVAGLTDWYASRRVDAVLSSPAVRCVATVLPVANHHEVDLATTRALLVGADRDARKLIRRLCKQAVRHGQAIVVCTHGEVLPGMLDALGYDGDGSAQHAKGSVWTVEGQEDPPTFRYELPHPGDDPVRT